MKNLLAFVAATACALFLTSTVDAQNSVHSFKYSPPKMGARPIPLSNTSIRVSALIAADGTIVRSMGVKSVTHPTTGEYCVRLNNDIPAKSIVPVFSFDFNSSPDFEVFVAYAPNVGTEDCPHNSIGVETYNADTGSHVSEDEGFTIIAP
jgi:hypothetical protein